MIHPTAAATGVLPFLKKLIDRKRCGTADDRQTADHKSDRGAENGGNDITEPIHGNKGSAERKSSCQANEGEFEHSERRHRKGGHHADPREHEPDDDHRRAFILEYACQDHADRRDDRKEMPDDP